MVHIGIYDEDNTACQKTWQYLMEIKRNPDIIVKKTDMQKLKLAIEEYTFDFHILVMEVISEETDVLQLVAQINRRFPDCQIIYLTSQEGYVSRVYETEHCYFVWKQELEQIMPLALYKALKRIEIGGLQYIRIICDRKHMEIPISQILYIERFQHRCKIVTFEGEYQSYLSLKQLENRLPKYFIRCHTGYLANGRYIESISGRSMILGKGIGETGGQRVELPVGRNYADRVKKIYSQYFEK